MVSGSWSTKRAKKTLNTSSKEKTPRAEKEVLVLTSRPDERRETPPSRD